MFMSRKEPSQELINRIFQKAGIGTWELDVENGSLYWSPIIKELHEVAPDYQPDLESALRFYQKGIHQNRVRLAVTRAMEQGESFDLELLITTAKGRRRWVRALGEAEFRDGECIRVFGSTQNIDYRKEAEEALQQSEQRFRSLVQNGMDMIAIVNAERCFSYVSPPVIKALGYRPDALIGVDALDLMHEEDRERVDQLFKNLPPRKRTSISPYRYRNADGQWRWIESTLTNLTDDPAVNGYVVNSLDITDRKIQQQRILESLHEKEVLLSEVHHRVKNNLAVISGMMQLQAEDEADDVLSVKLLDSVSRIKTIANIHEQIYKSDMFAQMNFAQNIRMLFNNLMDTFQYDKVLSVHYDCEPVELNINQAIPCSLMVNEVVTNTLKHAFPGRKKGLIAFHLSEKNGYVRLKVKDNGVGLPPENDSSDCKSLGMHIVRTLARQLKGECSYHSAGQGTEFSIVFKKVNSRGSSDAMNGL